MFSINPLNNTYKIWADDYEAGDNSIVEGGYTEGFTTGEPDDTEAGLTFDRLQHNRAFKHVIKSGMVFYTYGDLIRVRTGNIVRTGIHPFVGDDYLCGMVLEDEMYLVIGS